MPAKNTDERKLKLIASILEETDPKALDILEQKVAEISYDKASHSKLIGFRPNGSKVIKYDFMRCITQTLDNLNHGEFIALDELERRSQNW